MRTQFPSKTFFTVLVCMTTVMAQQRTSGEKSKAVVIPREIGLVSIAYQPDCPLQFENVKFLAGIDGGGAADYDLRNRGTKPIRAFTVADSIGNKISWNVEKYRGPVFPNQLVPW